MFPLEIATTLNIPALFKSEDPKLAALPSCSLDFNIPKGQIVSEDSLHRGKLCLLGSTEDERVTRDIQCFLAVMVHINLKEQEGAVMALF